VIKAGLYQHFKGAMYRVMHVAQHSETEEPLVIYRALYGEKGVWARPLSMFTETVDRGGEIKPRFAYLDNQSEVEQRIELSVKQGQLAEFEVAFAAMESMIVSNEFYITHSLSWSIENADTAVLSIYWQSPDHASEISFAGLSEFCNEGSTESFSTTYMAV